MEVEDAEPGRAMTPEEVLDELRDEVKEELEEARRESANAEAEVSDLRQEIDRIQAESLESKFLLKKQTMEREREKATFQHEIRELQRYIHDNKAKIEALEAKAIVARRIQLAKEAEVREVLARAEAAEENGAFLKAQCETSKRESLSRTRKEFEESMLHIEMEHKVQMEKAEERHKAQVEEAIADCKRLYESKIKDAKAALLHSQHEALIVGEKLKAAEARIMQLEQANPCCETNSRNFQTSRQTSRLKV